eukprot:CAMPEP_0206429510 /NCGR_PEP_ID=MMETSP0324_2-20121206/6282_1 /ASSEMBLY_ACC=CAM_ASM_000836 /TAXON_ID=2866 /ORGANISM="Crypthecodinium cohnii, Strain Seligo" /LENGTH=336 /DNA_ID=CAMNT_0053895201 /DNA_START=103 /DNA_END=1113 /DNA_ORIENTATION=-
MNKVFKCFLYLGLLTVASPYLLFGFLSLRFKWRVRPPADQVMWNATTTLTNVHGIPSPPGITTKRVTDLANPDVFEQRNDDVWVVTYPKSGTTWLLVTVGSIYQRLIWGIQEHEQRSFCQWPEIASTMTHVPFEELESLPSPRIFKSHWHPKHHLDPSIRKGKVIFVMRNVVDLSVSYYQHYLDAWMLFDFWGTSSDWFELFINGDIGSGSYFEYIKMWWPYRNDERVLWLRYEEAKADPVKMVKTVAKFVGAELNQTRLEHVLWESSFEHMKSLEDNWLAELARTLGFRKNKRARDRLAGDTDFPNETQVQRMINEYERVLAPIGVPRHWILKEK